MKKSAVGIVRYQRSKAGGECACCKGKHIFSRFVELKKTDVANFINDFLYENQELENKKVKITIEEL